MINVVIWLGKIKYSADLAIVFARNNIRIVDENFENTDDFIDRFDSLDANVDVLVIADALLLGTDRKKLFQRIRQIEPNIRIVIVFPGYRNQYIEDQISEYKNVYGISDIIYEGNRLDEDYFADVIKKGYIYDYEVNVYDEPGEETRVILPEKKADRIVYKDENVAGINDVFTSNTPVNGICGTYANAFIYLCQRADIPCVTIKDATHAWNEVYIDGRWQIIDVSYYDVARTDESLFTTNYPRIDTTKEKTEFAKELLVPGSTAE